MSQNSQWDVKEFDPLFLPYNKAFPELSDEPRIVAGINTICSYGGKINKRPGTPKITPLTNTNQRIDRCWILESNKTTGATFDSQQNEIYLLASMPVSIFWEMQFCKLSDATPTWTSLGTLRDLNLSQAPHTVTIVKGIAYIKSFPLSSSSEKLGTVSWDPANEDPTYRVKPWGILAPTIPVRMNGLSTYLINDITAGAVTITVAPYDISPFTVMPAVPFNVICQFEQMTVTAIVPNGINFDWTVTRGVAGTTATSHLRITNVSYQNYSFTASPTNVNYRWRYSYAYISNTGQYSNRAPDQNDPYKPPDSSQPTIYGPQIVIQGSADPNIDKIAILRTTDGGGTFYVIEEIDNFSSGLILYSDIVINASLQPIGRLDYTLNTDIVAPSRISNSPPPGVNTVVGVDTPVLTIPPVEYSSRIWIAIGSELYFSANEEISSGRPEESFIYGGTGAFGGVKSNRYTLPGLITGMISSSEALYIFTTKQTFKLSGTTRDSFDLNPLFDNIGMLLYNPYAVTRVKDTIFFMTSDLKIASMVKDTIRYISDPLYTDLVNTFNTGGFTVNLAYLSDLDKELLCVCFNNQNTVDSKQYVYDIKKSETLQSRYFEQEKESTGVPQKIVDFWNTPWTIATSWQVAGQIKTGQQQNKLVFATFTNGTLNGLSTLDTTNTIPYDENSVGRTQFSVNFTTHLIKIPIGNHMNIASEGSVSPKLYAVAYDRSQFTGDTDPTVSVFKDSLGLSPEVLTFNVPWRRAISQGFKSLQAGYAKNGRRFSLKFEKPAVEERFELQNFSMFFEPGASG